MTAGGGAEDHRAAPGPATAIAASLALAAVFVLGPLAWWLLPVTDLPAPFADHHQDAETLTFLLAFAVLMPLGVAGSLRITDRIVDAAGGAAASVVAAVLSSGLAGVVVFTRASAGLPWGSGPGTLAVTALLWWALASAVLWRATSPRPWDDRAAARWSTRTWAVAALLVVPLALSFVELGSVSWPVVLVGGAVTAAVLVLRELTSPPMPPRRLGTALDLAIAVTLLLAVPNVVIFAFGDPSAGLDNAVLQFHQNFYLGPANQILAGDAMLVDVLSQYGVGSIYFLAGLFTVVPIGNGTIGLIEGVLSALVFLATFATLRIAGVSRLLAAATMAVAVIALVYGLRYPIGGLLQHGAIRFGLPAGVILGAVVESRWPRTGVGARWLQLLTLGVASIWALEAFAYTALTVLAVAGLGAAMLPAERRRTALATWALQTAAACLVAHALLAAGTLAAVGELPDWGWYLNTLQEFLFGQIGDLTYDFSSFSPGLALGGLYLASAAAVAVIVLRRPELAIEHRTLVIAIGGTTAHGVALLSYLVNRSADHIVPYVSLPAVALGALWLALSGGPGAAARSVASRAALAIGLSLATIAIAAAWPSVGGRYEESALAHAAPGGPSLRSALAVLRDPPPLRSGAAEGVALLDAHMPGDARSIVLTDADLSVEILLRAGRGGAVPLGDPWEDSFVPDQHLDQLADFVAGLSPGDRVLLDGYGRAAFERYRQDPTLDPLAEDGEGTVVPSGVASLQGWVLREIGLRFDLRTIVHTDIELEVVELVPLRSS